MPRDVLPSARMRTPAQNLVEFVRHAREDLAAFGTNIDFDAAVWDVTSSRAKRLSSARRTDRLYFTTAEGGQLKALKGRIVMREPFASFAKAFIRRREETKSRSADNHKTSIRAARYLYDALAKKQFDAGKLLSQHFQVATTACGAREMPSSRYRIGVALYEISKAINKYGISKTQIDFINPFPRVVLGTRIGKEHAKAQAEKLPSEAALDALAQIANLVTEPADIVRIRCIELLVSGGWRINEALTIPRSCDVTEPAVENGVPILGADGTQIERYGIRYFGEKGFGPAIKWIPTAMVDVAKRAIADIQRETSSARELARWLERNPERAFIPAAFSGKDRFTMKDITRLLGLASSSSANSWIRSRHVPFEVERRAWIVGRPDLEAALLAEQPDPSASNLPLKLSEYLFLVHLQFFQKRSATNPCVLSVVTDGQIDDFLQGRTGIPSIFERLGFTEKDGTPIKLTSHMFRHWLDTLMQQGGMDQKDIARWSGRKDIRQNVAYDHVSGVELASQARALMAAGQVKGFVAEVYSRLPPVRRETFREAQFATAHTTGLGMCVHDWSLVPCPLHGACAAGCGDHWIEKGNEEQCQEAARMLDEQQWLLERAQMEIAEETYGASNYVNHNRRLVRGLTKIIAIHKDPEIPNGTRVQVSPSTPTRYSDIPLDTRAL